jgi:hypothetical protein
MQLFNRFADFNWQIREFITKTGSADFPGWQLQTGKEITPLSIPYKMMLIVSLMEPGSHTIRSVTSSLTMPSMLW